MSFAGAGSAWAQRDIGPTLRRFFGAFYNGHLKEYTFFKHFKTFALSEGNHGKAITALISHSNS